MTQPSPRSAGSETPAPPALGLLAPDGALRRLARRFTLRQISTLTGLLGIAIVVIVTGFIAWNEHRVLDAEARDHAQQSAAYLSDHALRLFEVSDLVLHSTATAVGGLSPEQIEAAPDLLASLHRMDDILPYIETVFVSDAEGRVRATTLPGKVASYSVADRSVFAEAASNPTDRLLIGGAIVGRVTHRPTFLVARPRLGPDGAFAGIVGAAMSLSYFTDYWATLDKRNDEQIALVRADTGSVLARYPETGEARLGAAVAAASARGERSGAIPGGPHEVATFRQVGTLPVYLAVTFSDAAIAAAWAANLRLLLPPAAAAIAALILAMALARRLARREDVARRQIETARAVLSAANSRLEQRVTERTADLVETNREIQRFAYIVSHDLRAPLVNIMGFTSELQALRDEVLGPHPLDEEARTRLRTDFDEAFGFILSSIDKMDRLIKAILAMSRQGQRAFRPEPIDMDALMHSLVDGVAHRTQQGGVTITVEPLPPLVADRIAVEQVFANLIDNAVKYGRPGVPGRIAIAGVAASKTVTYTVTDNGRGVAPADQERVFDLFRRAGPQDQPGEGIGLANVRSLIRRLQGTIALDSRVGFGCVFTITLPSVGGEPSSG